MPRSRRPALAAAVLALAAGVAACGGGAAPASAPPPPSGVVVVEAREYEFKPATLSVGAGLVTFYVRNTGREEHRFEIFRGEQLVDQIEGLMPGSAKNLAVSLAAGDYTFVCKLNGHDQLGMKGTLTVTGS